MVGENGPYIYVQDTPRIIRHPCPSTPADPPTPGEPDLVTSFRQELLHQRYRTSLRPLFPRAVRNPSPLTLPRRTTYPCLMQEYPNSQSSLCRILDDVSMFLSLYGPQPTSTLSHWTEYIETTPSNQGVMSCRPCVPCRLKVFPLTEDSSVLQIYSLLSEPIPGWEYGRHGRG